MKMKTKQFDAVEMKRRGSARVYEATATMTREQQLAYWQQRTEELRKRQQALRAKRAA
jgi:hypothetical protein